jgi:hypothetical protein
MMHLSSPDAKVTAQESNRISAADHAVSMPMFKTPAGWLFAGYTSMPFRGAIVRYERNEQ